MKKTRIVVVSHEASYSGAPILLLNLLHLVKEKNWFHFDIVIIRGGPLASAFVQLAKTVVLRPEGAQLHKTPLHKLANYFAYKVRLNKARLWMARADGIFSNTIVNGKSLKRLNKTKKPVLVYVHELEGAIRAFNSNNTCTLSLQQATAVFCASLAIARNLFVNHGVSAKQLHLLQAYFQVPSSNPTTHENDAIIQLGKAKIDVRNKFLVAGMGTANLRKGIDLFIDVCSKVIQVNASVLFVWIGDFVEPELADAMHKKIETLHLQNHLLLTGFLPPDAKRLKPFQLLALTSREDPYPLVVLEAALLKKPALVFESSGGMNEFVKEGAGFCIPDLDAAAMADKILTLVQDREMLTHAGAKAYQKAVQEHANPIRIVQQLMPVLKTALKK